MYSNEYLDYLKSPVWRDRRSAAMDRAKHKCAVCGEEEGLQVHHKTYERLGNEAPNDLVALCYACHWMADEERRNPGFIENSKKASKEKSQTVCKAGRRIQSQWLSIHKLMEIKGHINRKKKNRMLELEKIFYNHTSRCQVCSKGVKFRE